MPAAIEEARKELNARDPGPWDIAAIARWVGARRKQEAEAAGQPLSRLDIFILLSSITVLPVLFAPAVLFAAALEVKGYKRKSLDAWSWMAVGAIIWFGIFVILFSK